MSITDYDNDFAHYECDEAARKKLGQVWTPYSVIVQLMDKLDKTIWQDEHKTCLDPTMGAGNIVIGKIDNSVIKNVSGNINIKKVNKINVESTTGDILIDNITDSANINTITGNIVINKYEINNNSDIETISGNIIIKVDKNSKCLLKIKSNNKNISEKVCLEGINLLSITNEVGEVTIK